jgi:hypothetical protein
VIGLAKAERQRQHDSLADAFDDRVGHPIRIFERDGRAGAYHTPTHPPSLPGLTPQVGFTRLAADNTAQLGQARVAVQSIDLRKDVLRRRWMPGSSPGMTLAVLDAAPSAVIAGLDPAIHPP